ncbi:ABC transporter ATP-binding protein [Pigmentibacter sp. JX0631]|uniref:ABC transporter ATP-binding protein n=1 Tax=Pigmentibacter sp. JX0631 TaxID=2976982 RepID=UPI0024684A71|nr:ABC transporter ATP-binding protein [Pigmentibacter sp. JX0631]WGL60926.1 ABC transporter ATP-binding protein [Pigmentibacter sp. JX0631]
MIEVNNLVKLFGERKVLHNLNFSVGTGRICGFLGPNGSGKSTTMDILAGLLGPSAGEVKICGFNVVTQSKEVKEQVGYLPDNPPLYKDMKVKDFVTYVAKIRGINSKIRKSEVDRVIEECDVSDVANRIIGNLSKGYRQRVALCSALVHRPNVLILDEPTEGLDPNQILHIRKLIKKLAKERTVILSSHILSEVQATCDEVIIINQGHIAAKTSIQNDSTKPSYYLYTFASKAENALHWFQQRNYVKSAKPMTQKLNSILVEFGNEFWADRNNESIANVTEQIVQQNFPLIGIEEKKEGLEELFFEVIRSQPGHHQVQILPSGELL